MHFFKKRLDTNFQKYHHSKPKDIHHTVTWLMNSLSRSDAISLKAYTFHLDFTTAPGKLNPEISIQSFGQKSHLITLKWPRSLQTDQKLLRGKNQKENKIVEDLLLYLYQFIFINFHTCK